jgi:hypothetical protein
MKKVLNPGDPGYEEAAQAFLDKLKAKDPQFELNAEFGKLLMKHVDDFTPEERKRFKELEEILYPKR